MSSTSQLGTSEECPSRVFQSLPWFSMAQSVEFWIDAFHNVALPGNFSATFKTGHSSGAVIPLLFVLFICTGVTYRMEKAMAPHSSTLAWKIPWTEEPSRLHSMGSLRVRNDWATSLSLSCIEEGNGNLLQCSCLENPRDRGAWWAALYGVAQSCTRLKRLSSSSTYRRRRRKWCVCVYMRHRDRQTDWPLGTTKGRTGWLSWSICMAVPSRKKCAWQTAWDPARQRQLFQHIS